MYKIMDGNEACSYVAYNFTELAGIYPITPASPMAEYADKWASTGKKNFWGDEVKVVKGRKVPVGTIANVKEIRPYYDRYHRWVCDYAYLDNGMKTNVNNLVRM